MGSFKIGPKVRGELIATPPSIIIAYEKNVYRTGLGINEFPPAGVTVIIQKDRVIVTNNPVAHEVFHIKSRPEKACL